MDGSWASCRKRDGQSGRSPVRDPLRYYTFLLHSRPPSKRIFLDVAGHTMASSAWDYGNALALCARGPCTGDLVAEVQQIRKMLAVYFSPLDVEITTQEPGSDPLCNRGGSDSEWSIRFEQYGVIKRHVDVDMTCFVTAPGNGCLRIPNAMQALIVTGRRGADPDLNQGYSNRLVAPSPSSLDIRPSLKGPAQATAWINVPKGGGGLDLLTGPAGQDKFQSHRYHLRRQRDAHQRCCLRGGR